MTSPPPPDPAGELARQAALLEQLRRDVADLQQQADEPPAEPAGEAMGEGPVEPRFGDVEQWVTAVFAPTFGRHLDSRTCWCPSWWDHAEAIVRLEALWRSWEAARLDPDRGIAVWLRDFGDPQLAQLTSPDGPFRQCTPDQHHQLPELPLTPAPADTFGHDTQQQHQKEEEERHG